MIQEERDRRERLDAIRNGGVDPYPSTVHRSHTIAETLAQFEDFESEKREITLCGRLTAIRRHGGITFLRLKDASAEIQVVLHRDSIGEEDYSRFHKQADVGDFFEFHGGVMVTKNGEQSLLTTSYRILSKTLLPLPEKWHGLTDIEIRYRQRYLDLLSNPTTMNNAKARSRMLSAMREFLEKEGFTEVETPILQAIPGGANAKPFITYHNSLHAEFYLRIAPELYLKRLIVGGFEKIFEVARCFRNEGISPQHNPEFTQIEAYFAYANIEMLTNHLEKLFQVAVRAVTGGQLVVTVGGEQISFANIPRQTFHDLILSASEIDLDIVKTEESLRQALKQKGIFADNIIGYGELADHLYKTAVRPKIIQPIFVTDYPSDMKPLAKRRENNLHYSASVQLVVLGMEMCNAFNELNDPEEQEMRFREQETLRARGSEDAQRIDEDYLTALKHGLPPTAGYGVGIDRLAALLTNSNNLKEVILFPTLKPTEN